ncbi:MAG: DUF2807 domain-containing protein [Bacteroidetes bacterium]|nr:DUF2807 domain-containing protein [Bacteroidota bacterium]
MKNIIYFIIFLSVGFCGVAQDGKVIRDGNAVPRDVKGFHAIEVSGGIDLYLSQGPEEAVAVSASDAEYRDRMRTVVSDGVLRIYMDNKPFNWGNWGNRHLKAYVSCKVVDYLRASGGSDVYIQDILKSDKLKMELSGGSDLKGKVTIGELTVHQSGGSDSRVSGTAGQLFVHTSGGSDYHGYELIAEYCQVETSGGSDAYVFVNKELVARASGGSDVHYKGGGVVKEKHTSGAGSVVHVN